jgi:hypothetical protein
MKVTGIIDSITSKTVSNGGTVFTALIDGTEVNLGFQCDYKEGEYAEIEVENTKWGLQVPRQSGKGGGKGTNSGAQTRPKVGSGATPRQQNTGVFPVDPNTKDHIIIRQNALTNANSAVASAIKAGAFKPKAAEEVYNEVIKVAYNLTGFSMGTLDAVLVEQAQKEQAKQAADLAQQGEAAPDA